jgi:hypothetical protein
MTKLEQRLYDQVLAWNEVGAPAPCPVARTRGGEKKHQRAAFDRLLASGAVVARRGGMTSGGYYVVDSPLLQRKAAEVDLLTQARELERLRVQYENALASFEAEQAFVRKWTKPVGQ